MTATWTSPDGAIQLYHADCLAAMRAMPADSVELVLGSPPYLFARNYGFSGKQWWSAYETWVETMLAVVTEASRICKGPVVIVVACPTRQCNYRPCAEALLVRWFERGGTCQLYRPVFWHRVGIPGSGQADGFRADVEYCLVFKRPGKLPWSDNTACGWPPRWAPGGEMSNRKVNGSRANQWGSYSGCKARRADGSRDTIHPSNRDRWGGTGNITSGEGRNADGTHTTRNRKVITRPRDGMHNQEQDYTEPVLANPGNYLETHEVIHAIVGGGVMGSKLAHENEAPYPEAVPERFIRSWCAEGGTVLDPWCGSGTTLAVAMRWGRQAIGIDVRISQIELSSRRVLEASRPLLEQPQQASMLEDTK